PAETLRSDPGIAGAFAHYDRLTTAVVAIGGWDARNSTVYQALGTEARERYSALGVCAEMSAQLFDSEGNQIHSDLAERIISVRAEQLRRVPEVVAVAGAGDAAKARAVGAALRSGLVSTLVTDSEVARVLLSEQGLGGEGGAVGAGDAGPEKT
ncbi:sugar-binding domain-containing protein, partial [Nocardiopsis salina]|uniref:sugar-binding domain-containing protein n=1 Tax=Nocardiopsis salina TaxID=245836 RepID=UPI00037175AA